MPRRPRRAAPAPSETAPLVPLAPEDFPSPAAYLAAWRAQRTHEMDRLTELVLSVGPRAREAARQAPRAGEPEADRIAEPMRGRFRAELRARALAHQHGIASPGGWPEVASGAVGHRAAAGSDRLAPWYDELPVAAGAGRELWDAGCEQWVALPPALPGGRHVALTVRGDSMRPLLADGDLVLVRLDPTPRRGRVAVARRSDGGYDAGYVVKQVAAVRAGAVTLASLNPAYGPLAVPDDGRHVLGTVVARWARDGWSGGG